MREFPILVTSRNTLLNSGNVIFSELASKRFNVESADIVRIPLTVTLSNVPVRLIALSAVSSRISFGVLKTLLFIEDVVFEVDEFLFPTSMEYVVRLD